MLPEADYIYDFSFPKKDGKPNPHLWTDPLYAIKYADVILATLVADGQPQRRRTTGRTTRPSWRRATDLSEALKADQTTIPDGKKELLTYHDAYAYFAKDYGWNVIGAVQPSNFDDPQPKEIARIIDQIRARKVPVIFGSEVFPSKVLKQIGRETGARYEDTLRDDDLPGKPGEARALVARPDALRLPDDDLGPRRHHEGAGRARCHRRRARQGRLPAVAQAATASACSCIPPVRRRPRLPVTASTTAKTAALRMHDRRP